MTSKRGFSFPEVMVAIVILSMALVVLLESQARSIDLVGRARLVDVAATLASEKMVEITQEVKRSGLSALKDKDQGEFDQEKYPDYRWQFYTLEVAAPDFASLMGVATGGLGEPEEDGASNAGLFAGPLKMIGEIWGKALRELHVEITWKEGTREHSYELVTHLIDNTAVNQVQAAIGVATGGQTSEPTPDQPAEQP